MTLIAVPASGCGGSTRTFADETGGAGGSGADASGGTAGDASGGSSAGGTGGDASGGTGGTGGDASGGVAGTGGSGPIGYPGLAVVPGGTVMKSANYTLVLTSGESPGGNGVMSSSNYRLQGGFVGATQ